jgi:conjugal transfer pilin signal peptidase TrbI
MSTLAWWCRGAALALADMRRRRGLMAVVAVTWGLALLRLFVYHTPVLPVMFNCSPSLPFTVVVAELWATPLARGDYVVFAFTGEAAFGDYPGLKGQPFFKRIVGMPRDAVEVRDRDVFVNGVFVGRAKTHTFDHRPLEPIAEGVIPDGYLYVQGTSVDSFDSRYRSSGLVASGSVKAKVHPLF